VNLIRLSALAAAVSLAGCAANVVKGGAAVDVPAASSHRLTLNIAPAGKAAGSADWAGFRGSFRDAISTEASAENLPFEMQDGPAKPTGQPGTLVAITVNDYHWVSTGARYGVGVMTGNAYVDARISFLDAQTGRSFGEETVNTSSSAWQGIFSAMTDKQLAAIAKTVVGDVKKR
jgi:hypothetical protein